ncbi:MAG: hypothetical protein KDK70_11505 [Myxococcales bacterium]|nr:hypothetical protein [Myxococcales bacterium]
MTRAIVASPLLLLALVGGCTGASSDDVGDDIATSDSTATSEGSTAGDSTGEPAEPPVLPDVDAATFEGDPIDNPYFPLPVGATWVLEAQSDEGLERISIEVLAETREIQGVTATVVRDTVTLDGEVVEDTWDWYAQDSEGNVWYLGEETCEFENGMCVSMTGAWEWGVDGALPGIIMKANPTVDGERYYSEYYVGEAEDAAEVIEAGVSVTVSAGTFEDCIVTHETSTLDLMLDERKYYCPGIGNVLVEEPDLDEELVEYDVP